MSRRKRRKTRTRRGAVATRVLVGAGVAALFVVLILVLPLSANRSPIALCAQDPSTFPPSGVDGWRGEQLENAAIIVETARSLGFGREGQILGVMTAMGESSLRNIDYGDWETSRVRNPDGTPTSSIGLFQQQDWWGAAEERMDPAAAATLFFTRLASMDGWQDMRPSHAIHRVQINSDRDYYARFANDAAAVVDAFSGAC